jgi:hypothetical protein
MDEVAEHASVEAPATYARVREDARAASALRVHGRAWRWHLTVALVESNGKNECRRLLSLDEGRLMPLLLL